MSLIPDGTYKIRNAQFTNFVADLIDGVPHGPISGYTEKSYNRNDKWKIVNYGGGGDVVTFESVSTPGSFADAKQSQDASLVGSATQTQWTIVKEDGDKYAIQAPDPSFVWVLPEGKDYVNILLVHQTGQENTKWTFEPVDA